MTELPLDPMVTRPALQRMLEVSRSTMRRWLKAGTLPPPDVYASIRTQAWKASTLRAAGFDVV